MTTYLLDANVLIALTISEHEHYERATLWAVGDHRLAICPVVEGALVRFLVRIGETTRSAVEVLRGVHEHADTEFWPDSLSYADVDLGHVQGHRQVTDAYLAGLAASRGARLATLDEALARELPQTAYLIPAD